MAAKSIAFTKARVREPLRQQDRKSNEHCLSPPPHAGDPSAVLYTAYVYQPGTQPQAEMKQKLDLLLQNVTVKER